MKRKMDSLDAATTSAYVDDGGSSSGAEFEVFLSFRGPDTRLNFTDCLYHSLVRVGIRVFRDDEEMRKGEKIEGELLRAIQSSKIYVPIFSRNYVSSAWCLHELMLMVECSSKANDKAILPIFYEVDPDDVKLKTQLYLDALKKHEESGRDVQQWKEALTKVARITGWATKDKGQGGIINSIVDEVFAKLKKRRRNLPDHLVGIHDRVEAIIKLLNKGPRDVHYLVIHGMGGIGKTTLASAVFNQISTEFQGSSFLSNVRDGRIIDLQKQLLAEILQSRDPAVHDSVDVGINTLRERCRDKKVLLVLDDVDKWDQFYALAGKSDWFGSGSKIIITSRDVNFLPIREADGESSFHAHYEEFEIYEMTELNSLYALQLFRKHAFRKDSPPCEYDDISHKITHKTGGLPLALEVIGSSLFRKSKEVWKATLKKLVLVPQEEVFNKLKISYDMLQFYQREIFLDIACYFIGERKLKPYYMWKASNYFPKVEVLALARMSLINIKNDRLWMHDQVRDFGREVIQREDVHVPGRRSRLWESKIVLRALRMKEATDKVEALRLKGLSKEHNFTSEEFTRLPNLRFMELEGGNLVGDFKNLLSNLTWLCWSDCPSKLNAENLHLEKLVVLELSQSNMSEDWTGWEQCLVSENLKVIEITGCPSFKRIPNFSKCSKLKKLVLQHCGDLLGVDSTLSKLERLRHLEISSSEYPAREACEIFALPYVLGGLKSLSTLKIKGMHVRDLDLPLGEMTGLKYLSLECCHLLKPLPESIGKLTSLLELELGYTTMTTLPHSIGDLKKLRKIKAIATRIEKLPDQIGGLESLHELDLRETSITELPASVGNLKRLEKLRLNYSEIRELPKEIGMLENLKKIHAQGCRNLKWGIPSEIGGLSFLHMLNLSLSDIRRLPATINQLSRLQTLDLSLCHELEYLPELPVSLGKLEFSSKLLWTALDLDLSYLTNLVELRISCFTSPNSEFFGGAPKIEWIKGLYNLRDLVLAMKDFAFPPINFAPLPRLRNLEMTLVDPRALMGLPSDLEKLVLYDVVSPIENSLFSSLPNLFSLSLYFCLLREIDLDDVLRQHPEKLLCLIVSDCHLLERLPVSKLKGLRWLEVSECTGLMEIQGGEKLGSLERLLIKGCSSLEWLPDLSDLKKLRTVQIHDCPLIKSPGLRLQDTCSLIFARCGISPAFSGNYKTWKDTYGRSGEDINSQL